jgi:hypothetical protein
MIFETVPVLPSTRQNAHQVINPTSRHYAEALGRVELSVPRDRDSSFEPKIAAKRQRRLTGIDELVTSCSEPGAQRCVGGPLARGWRPAPPAPFIFCRRRRIWPLMSGRV